MAANSDEAALEAKEQKKYRADLKTERLLREGVLQELLGRPDGRAFLRWLLPPPPTFAASPWSAASDRDTAYLCGVQANAVALLSALLELTPEAHAILLKETPYGRRPDHSAPRLTEFDTDDTSGTPGEPDPEPEYT